MPMYTCHDSDRECNSVIYENGRMLTYGAIMDLLSYEIAEQAAVICDQRAQDGTLSIASGEARKCADTIRLVLTGSREPRVPRRFIWKDQAGVRHVGVYFPTMPKGAECFVPIPGSNGWQARESIDIERWLDGISDPRTSES